MSVADDIFSAPKKVKKIEKKHSFEVLLDDGNDDLFGVTDHKPVEVCSTKFLSS